ncbi:PadR family transcriptional regulator [Kineococcus arenarius]|uniref:PadR family transcriptional regulator n=1 Tax=Kineococcus sp. SYSU DK007 TaxID=3383128 RepID=UPI003D7E9953
MLELSILGFLAEGPLHGYELRRRVARLSGYARPISDGSLYPAINRLLKAGWLSRHVEPGAGATQRYVLTLTDAGREELHRRLREPGELDITDLARFLTVLAFLSLLPSVQEQHAVLRRRLAFLEQPASFFYDGDRPLRRREVTDPYRQGMFTIAGATSRAERTWLHDVLTHDIPAAGNAPAASEG